ncbi:branched-chain amino acid ABC transporter permease [Paractinoplanes rhizophilus]|jgi:branched-chain amino acid transport system permease protein|uniref:Branched-chain amino acid ABC transporter permease n=1 Tax=Paractinoplanes rhizophilus TaxID=1416877 RepID=A0ABW2I4R2_9ACTN|nr:branched-chain amino acid ABC transporter permease [Actinoplanes sp.]
MNTDFARRATVPAAWLVLLAVAAYLPFGVGGPTLVNLQQVIYTAVGVMSLNLLSGLAGQISIGQSAYIGLAAYATALLVQHAGWSYWAALPVAVLLAFVLGALTGLPALRITGIRLALTTLAIAIIFPTIPVKFSAQTGGTPGMNVDPLTAPASWGISTVAFNYWVLLAGLVVIWVIVRNVLDSRIGRSLLAVRDHQIAAHTVGINVSVTKVLVFGASAAVCGVAGWMFVVTNQFVAPGDFSVLLAIYLLAGMAIGGAGTLIGPIFGGLFIVYAPQSISSAGLSPLLTPLIYGVVLILILLVLPQGLGGLLAKLGARIRGPLPPTRVRPAPAPEVPAKELV